LISTDLQVTQSKPTFRRAWQSLRPTLAHAGTTHILFRKIELYVLMHSYICAFALLSVHEIAHSVHQEVQSKISNVCKSWKWFNSSDGIPPGNLTSFKTLHFPHLMLCCRVCLKWPLLFFFPSCLLLALLSFNALFEFASLKASQGCHNAPDTLTMVLLLPCIRQGRQLTFPPQSFHLPPRATWAQSLAIQWVFLRRTQHTAGLWTAMSQGMSAC